MDYFNDQPDFNQFKPDMLIEWAASIAEDAAKTMSFDTRLTILRRITALLSESELIDVEEEGDSPAFETAAQVLFFCKLFPLIFSKTYDEIEPQVDEIIESQTKRQEAIESLKRSFEL